MLGFGSSDTELDRVIYYIGIIYDGTWLGTVMVGVWFYQIVLFCFLLYDYRISIDRAFMCDFFPFPYILFQLMMGILMDP